MMALERFEGLEGKRVRITPVDKSAAYVATVRSVHEDGITAWLDPAKKDEGIVKTIVGAGLWKNASVDLAN